MKNLVYNSKLDFLGKKMAKFPQKETLIKTQWIISFKKKSL
jgi:hypothetical protein